jgi:hypothetical protein
MHVKFHVCPYVRRTLLWINVAENWNCLTTFSACVPYRTPNKYAEQLSSGNRPEIDDQYITSTQAFPLYFKQNF